MTKQLNSSMKSSVDTKDQIRSAAPRKGPTDSQLMLPLLSEISALGGRAKPAQLYATLAERLDVPEEILSQKRDFGGQSRSLWERRVRWARQTAVLRGLIATPERGVWELTRAGDEVLEKAKPGIILTIFETSNGAALWASAEDAAGIIAPGSLDLIYLSPPYPILSGRDYGRYACAEWLDWMTGLGSQWHNLLADTGSLMLNLGTAWTKGAPTQEPYIERITLNLIDDIGFYKAGHDFWHNPNKMPSPMPWVAVRRVRPKPSVEHILWFSKSRHPKASTDDLLTPYKASTLARLIGKPSTAEDRTRPSGYRTGAASWARDNGGAIPSNLIVASPAGGNSAYNRTCRQQGFPQHPATFPDALPERAIKLTTEPGDIVYDPMGGSLTTARVAERLGRRWLTNELALGYLRGGITRFEDVPDLVRHPFPTGSRYAMADAP